MTTFEQLQEADYLYTEACEASEQGGNTPDLLALELAAKKNLQEARDNYYQSTQQSGLAN